MIFASRTSPLAGYEFGSVIFRVVAMTALAFCLSSPVLAVVDDDERYVATGEPYDKYFSVAMKLQESGRLDEADQIFTMAINKYPDAIKLYYFRGKLRHHYMGEYSSAIQDYTKTINMNPNYNPKAYWRRGECLSRLGEYSYAISDYTRCLKLKPGYARVHMLRAEAYEKMGVLDKAIDDYVLAAKYDRNYVSAVKRTLDRLTGK